MDEVALGFRFSLATVFLLAGLGKLSRRSDFVRAVRNYKLLPDRYASRVGHALPLVEVLGGLLLMTGLATPVVAAVLVVLLLAFTGAVAVNLVRGRRIDCGCDGGVAERRISWITVARDLTLACLGAVVVWQPAGGLSIDELFGWSSGHVPKGLTEALLITATLTVVVGMVARQALRASRLTNMTSPKGIS